jgi:hypothetical protein
MSDDDDEVEMLVEDELETLKTRANMLGIKFHPSISLDTLRERVNSRIEKEVQPTPVNAQQYFDGNANSANSTDSTLVHSIAHVETENERRIRLKRDSIQLIRVKIACMNPAKKEWTGEVFTTGNALLGTIRQFVPFNNDEGWHVRKMIYQMMKEKECQIFTSKRDDRGNTVRKSKIIKEFSIEVMPQLTMAELAELAQRQALTQAIDA